MPADATTRPPTPRRPRDERGPLRSGEWRVIDRELGLSAREHEIVELLLAGTKESAIGASLGISRHTVHTHLERLCRKLGVHGRVQLIVRVFAACLAQMRTTMGVGAPAPVPGADPETVSPEMVTRETG